MKHTPKIGAFVLETLTTGMYANPFDSIREYVQNASDSIFKAEQWKLFEKNKGRIVVEINPIERSLVIKDNGTGISSSEVTDRLLNIGMSSKNYLQEAGFRGIGRLAGIAYCQQLKFITSYQNEDERSIITFDCEGIRKAISPAMREVKELADVIKKNTDQDLIPDNYDSHYFEVHMLGIDTTTPQLLDFVKMEEYLSQVVPVEYDAQRFIFAPKIYKWTRDNGIVIPFVNLLIKSPDLGDPRQVFKPFIRSYKTRKGDYSIDIKDISFNKIEDSNGLLLWMWYSHTDLLGMFDDPKVAGLRFRRNNIAIGGPERVEELFPGNEGRLNYWLIGEIHVVSNEVVPNARRDGFESTPAWESLKDQLQPFIRDHCKACHDASSASNRPTVKVVSSAKATVQSIKKALNVGIASQNERDDLLKKLEKEEKRVQAAFNQRDNPVEQFEVQRVLTSIKDVRMNLESQNGFTIKKIKSNLDRKQKKILIDVLELVDKSIREQGCKRSLTCLESIKKKILFKYSV